MDARDDAWQRYELGTRAATWFQAVQDLVAYLDPDLRLLYANQAFETTTGLPFDETVGHSLTDLRPFGDATESVIALLAKAEKSQIDETREVTWHLPHAATTLHHQVHAQAQRATDGTVTGFLLTACDVTQVRAVQHSLADSQTEFRTLADNSPDNIIRYGLDGRATYCNREISSRVNTTPISILGSRPLDYTPPGMLGLENYRDALEKALQDGTAGRVELSVLQPDGSQATHSVLIRAEQNADGEITGAIAIGRDVTGLAQARQAAAEREREYRTLAENAGDQIARWDLRSRFLYANPQMLDVLGLPATQVFDRTLTQIGHGAFSEITAAISRVVATSQPELIEQRHADHRDGREHIYQVRCVPEFDEQGTLTSVLGVGRDITESVRHREDLERIARTDLLTGLPNSKALFDHGPTMLDAAQRSGRRIGVLLFDLDGFKAVNDTVGHSGGDEVLRAVAEQVSACVEPGDLFARLGGDEFAIVVDDIDVDDRFSTLAENVLHSLAELSGLPAARGTQIGASLGAVVFPEDGTTFEALLSNADVAMYQAKKDGRGRVTRFRRDFGTALQRRALIQRALESPNLPEQLVLYAQPVYRFGPEQQLAGAEALVRWHHPTLGRLMPDEFIPLAEETGTIVPIGRWVLQQSAAAVARWNSGRRSGLDPLVLAVNFSTRQFLMDDLIHAVEHALEANDCDPQWIVAEITENLLLEDSDSIQRILHHLRDRGIRIAIDDFGMGYSALHYLTRFPLDMLKIDRRFIEGVRVEREHDELVTALVAMAQALGLTVVAEGIETTEQFEFLVDRQCDFGQGFLLGKPAPLDQFEADHIL